MPVINGTASADSLAAPTGSWENWTIYGFGGDDVLTGGNGKNILDGGLGADQMYGSYDVDIFYIDNVGDVTNASYGDEIRTSLTSYSLGFDVWKLTGLLTPARS